LFSAEVTRRYSDFVWLHEQLTKAYPGCVIPPLPDKVDSVLGYDPFNPRFVERRRKGLQLFLSRVTSHKELSVSYRTSLFLEADTEVFEEGQAETRRQEVHETSAERSATAQTSTWSAWLSKANQKTAGEYFNVVLSLCICILCLLKSFSHMYLWVAHWLGRSDEVTFHDGRCI
jgi:hypothetical protein